MTSAISKFQYVYKNETNLVKQKVSTVEHKKTPREM